MAVIPAVLGEPQYWENHSTGRTTVLGEPQFQNWWFRRYETFSV